MQCTEKVVDELLAFNSPPELQANNRIDQAFANVELEGFDFDAFLSEDKGILDEVSWLNSEYPALAGYQGQAVFSENLVEGSTAKFSTARGSHANVSSYQAASSAFPILAQPMVSPDLPIYSPSPQPAVQSEALVNPTPHFLPSPLPSAYCGLGLPTSEFEDFYTNRHELPGEITWVNQQILEQTRFEQGNLEQQSLGPGRPEQPRAGQQPIPNYTELGAADEAFEERMQAGRQVNRSFAEISLIPATLPQRYGQEINQLRKAQSGKISKRVLAGKNKRTANRLGFHPTDHYFPLPKPPQSWGNTSAHTRQPTFHYNAQGELRPAAKFTVEQVKEYIETHPLHNDSTVNPNPPAAKSSGLILWVQICPADSKNRYVDGDHSSKCRFENCPHPQKTIGKGEYRVAFDEQWCKQMNHDPFHNAGYVHLYCFEKYFDFPRICKEWNVRPDTRRLTQEPKQKNKMAITRDSPMMEKVVNDYIKNSVSWKGQRPKNYYSDTLCWALTLEHLKREPKSHKKKRDKRGGNNIDLHLNNIDVLAENLSLKKQGLPLIYCERPTLAIERPPVRKRKQQHGEEPGSLAPPSKIPRAIARSSQAASPESLTNKLPRPRILTLVSRYVEEQASKLTSSTMIPQYTKRKHEDDCYDANAMETSLWVKRSKHAQQLQGIPHNESEYDADESELSTPPGPPQIPLDKQNALCRKSLGMEKKARSRDAYPQRIQHKKRKSCDPEGEEIPAEVIREMAEGPMARYGLNKKHIGRGTAQQV